MKILYSNNCSNHKNSDIHPECPERNIVLSNLFKADFSTQAIEIHSPSNNLDILKRIHDPQYVLHILEYAQRSYEEGTYNIIDGDTSLSQGSIQAIQSAFEITLEAVKLCTQDRETVFACTRPPGHHAEFDKAMGFCFFCWVFIAAKLIAETTNQKVLIIDFDVHHGNGTDHLIRHYAQKGENKIGFISLHESPLFPDTGLKFPETEHPDFILNIPYPPNTSGYDFFEHWDTHVHPFIAQFNPDYIIVSAGFDAHIDDPLSTAKLSDDDFERIGRNIAALGLPSISFLEGGYNLEALENSVMAYLEGLQNL
jgi:acetoin utilization deacetylase AcuC-like enzyme